MIYPTFLLIGSYHHFTSPNTWLIFDEKIIVSQSHRCLSLQIFGSWCLLQHCLLLCHVLLNQYSSSQSSNPPLPSTAFSNSSYTNHLKTLSQWRHSTEHRKIILQTQVTTLENLCALGRRSTLNLTVSSARMTTPIKIFLIWNLNGKS